MAQENQVKRIILLSGGMDSIALAFWLRPSFALTVDYGQISADGEFQAASQVAAELGIKHERLKFDSRSLGLGLLAGTDAIPLSPAPEWWPFRNQLLVTLAAMKAIQLGAQEILIGTVATDSNLQDGTPSFNAKLSELLTLQEGALKLSAPGENMETAELVRESGVPFELLAWAHSCHTGNFACGQCRGCFKHQRAMNALGYGLY